MREIKGLIEIIAGKKAILCDLWGVLHGGGTAFPGAIRALENLRKREKFVILLSNSPKPSWFVKKQIAGFGIRENLYKEVVSSGKLVGEFLKAYPSKKIFFIGPKMDEPIFKGLSNPKTDDLRKADFILCTGFFEDWPKNPSDYEAFLNAGVENGIPFICANPDTEVFIGEKKVLCAGALAQTYEGLGGEVYWFGKPWENAYKKCLEFLPGRVKKEEILAIGDNLATDIKGAGNFGLETLFIGEGLHGKFAKNRDDLETSLKKFGVRPDYFMARLDW